MPFPENQNYKIIKIGGGRKKKFARLLAVQYLYAQSFNESTDYEPDFFYDFPYRYPYDHALYKEIIVLVQTHYNTLIEYLKPYLSKPFESYDHLMRIILVSGLAELYYVHADKGLIIAEYLDICDAYYDLGTAKIVHAIFDKVNPSS